MFLFLNLAQGAVDEAIRKIGTVEGVLRVLDSHVWSFNDSRTIGTFR